MFTRFAEKFYLTRDRPALRLRLRGNCHTKATRLSCQYRSKNPQKCRSNFPHFRDLVTSQIMRLSAAPYVVFPGVLAGVAV